jgi:hypothetical protein
MSHCQAWAWSDEPIAFGDASGMSRMRARVRSAVASTRTLGVLVAIAPWLVIAARSRLS